MITGLLTPFAAMPRLGTCSMGKEFARKRCTAISDLVLLPIKNIDLPLKVPRNTKKKRTRQHEKRLDTSIEQRPQHIDERLEFGHWEIDTVFRRQQKRSGASPIDRTQDAQRTHPEDRSQDGGMREASLTGIEATVWIRILNRVQNDHIRQRS